MIYTICRKCGKAYNVVGRPSEVRGLLSQWHKGSLPCVTPHCPGRAAQVGYWDGAEAIPVDVYYRALNGMGPPRACAPAAMESVVKLLMEKKIVEVQAYRIGQPERTIIDRLVMDDGTVLHLGPSASGACVYFVESDDESVYMVADSDPQDSFEDRGEVGLLTPEGEGGDVAAHESDAVGDPVSALRESGEVRSDANQ